MTNGLTCVNAYVHVVGHPLVEALVAVLTAVLLPVAVDLHVRAEVASVVEVLPALRTRGCELPCAFVDAAVIFIVS